MNLPELKTYCSDTRFKFCFMNVKSAQLEINFRFNVKNVYCWLRKPLLRMCQNYYCRPFFKKLKSIQVKKKNFFQVFLNFFFPSAATNYSISWHSHCIQVEKLGHCPQVFLKHIRFLESTLAISETICLCSILNKFPT